MRKLRRLYTGLRDAFSKVVPSILPRRMLFHAMKLMSHPAAYSTSPESTMRLMMVFPSSYGDGFTWPFCVSSVISLTSPLERMGVKNDIFEVDVTSL